jgi:hypothetical protein
MLTQHAQLCRPADIAPLANSSHQRDSNSICRREGGPEREASLVMAPDHSCVRSSVGCRSSASAPGSGRGMRGSRSPECSPPGSSSNPITRFSQRGSQDPGAGHWAVTIQTPGQVSAPSGGPSTSAETTTRPARWPACRASRTSMPTSCGTSTSPASRLPRSIPPMISRGGKLLNRMVSAPAAAG